MLGMEKSVTHLQLFVWIIAESSVPYSDFAIIPGYPDPQEGCHMDESDLALMLKGYGLTTAEMTYRMPDYRNVLNTFVWQNMDLEPDYPRLFEFIEFWQETLDGPLHSVRFVHRRLIGPGEWRNVTGEFYLN